MTSRCPPSTFEKDLLNRKKFADILTELIKEGEPTTNENSFVMALNSPWGSGKTCFIDMWIDQMNKDHPEFNIIKYNAWENDDCNNALLPIICSFNQLLPKYPDINKEEIDKRIVSGIKTVASGVLKIGASVIVGSEVVQLADKFYNVVTTPTPEDINAKYKNLNQEKEAFKKLIGSFVPDGGKLLIFIDELDRCRPTYAIETLEVVKHFFDIDGVVFVFSVDITQLSHSIKNIYGAIDSVGYLQRFFDRQIFLPRPHLMDLLKKNLTVERNGNPIFLSDTASIISELTIIFSFSLRDVEIICSNLRKFYDDKAKISLAIYPYKSSDRYKEFRAVYALLFALKYGQPLLYADIVNNGVNLEDEYVKKLKKIGSKGIDMFLSNYNSNILSPSNLLEMPIYGILSSELTPGGSSPVSNMVATCLIYWHDFEDNFQKFPTKYQSTKLSDVIRNNVESSRMF
ncbi:KAP family P-loop NTPase fold protein [uncultured Methanocorpusculum sp.]|nr:P-loop NTPase fold protein [uncultured Methanocorpusculum sp.]